jgi:hypothetical protein
MLTNHLPHAKVVFSGEHSKYPTFREMVHACTVNHPWMTFGNDMLLGVKADFQTTKREWQFLPAHAMEDFDKAIITDDAGNTRPLVKQTVLIVPAGEQVVEEDFPLRPRSFFLIALAVTIFMTIIEAFSGRVIWWYDALLMVLCGLSGIVLTMMLFSQHPTVRINLQMLLLNPLPLFFVWRMVQRARKRLPDSQYIGWIILICLFYIGGIWQHYAEGLYFLASSLLIRNVWCFLRQRKNNEKASLH